MIRVMSLSTHAERHPINKVSYYYLYSFTHTHTYCVYYALNLLNKHVRVFFFSRNHNNRLIKNSESQIHASTQSKLYHNLFSLNIEHPILFAGGLRRKNVCSAFQIQNGRWDFFHDTIIYLSASAY